MDHNLRTALSIGDPQQVATLINAGAEIGYRDANGYDALINAVYGRAVLHDSRLIELLNLLIERGVSLTGMTSYGESAVRVLSRLGRFDAVRLLLDAGANPVDLEMTELIEAVAFGSLADVEEAISGADLEGHDWWERTAWLVAIQIGDIAKARLLLEYGADRQARGRCGKPPLFYAIENGHSQMLKWLLEIGMDPQQTDDFGDTALATAAEAGNADAVEILLEAGADVNQTFRSGSALSNAETRPVAMRLLEAGADPLELSSEGRRAILGFPPEPDAELLQVSADEYWTFRTPRFGERNPERMNNPFWEGMIRSGLNAYQAAVRVVGERQYDNGYGPTWCAQRFGQSITFLEDGRIVQIAGEHEDHYDPDFCIYNDVFVHDPAGNITLYGYPETVFPPTDFHTATLIGGHIYVIGSLGYQGTRLPGETPVYRLNVSTFEIERLITTGNCPGWIYHHRALQSSAHEIQVSAGKIVTISEGLESHTDDSRTFVLDIETLVWVIKDE